MILREWRNLWPGGLSEEEYSTLNYIAHCRHGELGFNAAQCKECHDVNWYPSSCGNRHCPNCLGPRQAQWSEKVCERLPDCPHFHTVFTIPDEARDFFELNYRKAASVLFESASECLKQFQRNNWGVEGGFLAVLHTWGSMLNWHPHLHVLVSAGGRELEKGEWKEARATYQFPVTSMSKVYRAIFVRRIEELDDDAAVVWPEAINSVEKRREWRLNLARKPWVVFNRPTLDSTRSVVRYLARYTSRIAISNSRIKKLNEKERTVTFERKDYRNGGGIKECEMAGRTFIRSFARHLVPKGFRRIRYFGIICGTKGRHRSIPKAPGGSIGERAVEKQIPKCECCGASRWIYLSFHVRPFAVTQRGGEVKSFSLVCSKGKPPPTG